MRAVRDFGLRNRDDSLLDVPAKQNLRFGFTVFFSELRDSVCSEVAAQERSPCDDLDAVFVAEGQKRFIVHQRIVFDLVDHRCNFAVVQQKFELADFEVADADASDKSLFEGVFHRLPGGKHPFFILTGPVN